MCVPGMVATMLKSFCSEPGFAQTVVVPVSLVLEGHSVSFEAAAPKSAVRHNQM